MTEGVDGRGATFNKRKAISALLLYAIRLMGGGQQQMIGPLSRALRPSFYRTYLWRHVEPLTVTLFDKPSTPSLDRAIILVSPWLPWEEDHFNQNTVTRWSTAALATLAVQHTEEVGQSVADTLWQIVSVGTLRQHIPIGIWLWSSKQTFIPPARLWDRGRDPRGREATREFRELGDIEVLKSYLLFVWLEWAPLQASAFAEMCASIREDFNGIGMGQHREDLRKRLDHVLLDREPVYVGGHRPDIRRFGENTKTTMDQYRKLKQVLLEVDGAAMQILTRTPSRFVIPFDLLTSVDTHRIPLDVHV